MYMTNSQIVKRAVLSAIGVTAYVIALTWFMSHSQNILGVQPPSDWLMGTLMLLIFVISACATGGLVLLKPMLMYLDGAKRDALHLLIYTVAALIVIAAIVLVVLVTVY